MRKIKLVIASFLVAATALVAVPALVPSGTSYALEPLKDVCSGGGASEVCDSSGDDAGSFIGTLINVLLFVVGTLAVIMIIFGGIQYTTSAGDAGRVAKAKNTLVYSIVGLLVAFLAYAVVNWVLKLF